MSTYTYKQALDRAHKRGGRAYANVLHAILRHCGLKQKDLAARIWGTQADPVSQRQVPRRPSGLSNYVNGKFLPRRDVHKIIRDALPNGTITLTPSDLTGDDTVEPNAEAQVIEDRFDNGLVRLRLDAPMHRFQALAILQFLAGGKINPESYFEGTKANFEKLAGEPSLARSDRWDVQIAKGGKPIAQDKIADEPVEISITQAVEPDEL